MKVSLDIGGAVPVLSLRGAIDESTEQALASVAPKLAIPQFVVDCEEVSSLNSFGSRQFMLAFEQFTAKSAVEFINCPAVFVSYYVLIQGFIGAGTLTSFYIQYTCSACGLEHRHQVVAKTLRAAGVLPKINCPQCKASMRSDSGTELDDILPSHN